MHVTPFEKLVTTVSPVKVEPIGDGKTGALLATYRSGIKAIVKPRKEKLPNGKSTQRGIPVSTHPQREVAFYELAKLLGYEDLVPETVLTHKVLPGKLASAQMFVPAIKLREVNPNLHDTQRPDWRELLVDAALRVPKAEWRKLLALDIIAGSRDRHAQNVGLRMQFKHNKPEFKLAAWDNATSFGTSFKLYHNVFHKFLFRRSVNFEAVWPVWDKLTLGDFQKTFATLLTPREIVHAYKRMRFFQDFPYRLPWRVASQGEDGPNEFPDYLAYFEPFVEHVEPDLFVPAIG